MENPQVRFNGSNGNVAARLRHSPCRSLTQLVEIGMIFVHERPRYFLSPLLILIVFTCSTKKSQFKVWISYATGSSVKLTVYSRV